MRRIPVLAALALAGLTAGIGTGHALTGHHDSRRQLASATAADEPSTTTSTTTPSPSTTSPTSTTPTTAEGREEATTTTTAPARHEEPTTTVPRHHEEPAPTTTVAPRPEPAKLTIGCVSDGGGPSVACHWAGVPDGTSRLVLLRETPGTPAQPLWSTTDRSARDHVDESAQLGVTYVYRVSAYDGDRFLATSNPERVKAGGGEPAPTATTMTLTCAATSETAVRCTWGDGPAGSTHFRLVRTVDDRRGRVVAEVSGEVRHADDTDAPLGPQTYWVQALDGTGKVLAVGRAEVDCCSPGDR